MSSPDSINETDAADGLDASDAGQLEASVDALLAEIEQASASLKQVLDPEAAISESNAALSDDGVIETPPAESAEDVTQEDVAEPVPESEREQEVEQEAEAEAEAVVDAEPDADDPADSLNEVSEVEESVAEDDEPAAEASEPADAPATAPAAGSGADDLAAKVAAMLADANAKTPSEPVAEEEASTNEVEPEALEEVTESESEPEPETVTAAADEAEPEQPIVDDAASSSPATPDELAEADADVEAAALGMEDDFDALLGGFEDADGSEVEADDEDLVAAEAELQAASEGRAVEPDEDRQARSEAVVAGEADREVDGELPGGSNDGRPAGDDVSAADREDGEAEVISDDEDPGDVSWPHRLRGIAVTALQVGSKPLLSQPPVVRDAVGWVSANTLFLGACVWVWHLFFQAPQAPGPDTEAVGVIQVDADAGASGDATRERSTADE